MAIDEPLPFTDDLVLMLEACDAVVSARVLAAVRSGAPVPVHHRDGYVFQHLLPGALSISELGRRLGVSQQAASKQVADLEARGLVRVDPDPEDRRARRVQLTEAARAVVEAGRRSRAAIAREVDEALGARAARQLRRSLAALADHLGAEQLVERRAFVPEEAR